MRLEQSFTVAAPAEEVWRALVDVQRVAPCLPGAEVSESDEEGVYRGLFTVKLGPTTVAYAGTLRMERVDERARTAVIAARGSDRRGQGGASATIASTVRSEGEASTTVDVVTDFTITGRLARFGRGGMIADVSRRLLSEFAACLQARLGRQEAAAAAPAAPAAPPRPAGEPEAPTGPPAAGAAASPPAAAAGAPAAPPAPAARPLDAGRLGRQVVWERVRGWWARLGRLLRRRGQPG